MADTKSSKKVLLIDDDPTILTTYEMAFTAKGYTSITARDGEQGLDILTKGPVDSIVVDLMMPHLDGKSFLLRVKDNENFKDIPIIVCTALIEDIEKNEIMNSGADAYLVKTDTDPHELVKKIDALIAKKKS